MTATRVGIGFDVHGFDASRPLILGGIEIPSSHGLAGHSDADVLLHAVIDAILGAAALGDIGTHFPDTDERWKNADSAALLAEVRKKVQSAGYRIVNVDATLMIQAPRMAPHVRAMREKISEVLGTEVAEISVKATTTEHLGFVGRREGVAAMAVCMLEK